MEQEEESQNDRANANTDVEFNFCFWGKNESGRGTPMDQQMSIDKYAISPKSRQITAEGSLLRYKRIRDMWGSIN